MPKPSLRKNSCGTNSLWGNGRMEVHTFPEVIISKVNVTKRLEFEHVSYDVTVLRVNPQHHRDSSPNPKVF